MDEQKESCVKPAGGPVGGAAAEGTEPARVESRKDEVLKMMARVGKEAPDFEANAFQGGAFKNVKLSDYRGQWVVLCFYPGDFTFV